MGGGRIVRLCKRREKRKFFGGLKKVRTCVFLIFWGGERNSRLNLNAPFSIPKFLGVPLDCEYSEQSSELFSELVFTANCSVTQDNKGNIIRSQQV